MLRHSIIYNLQANNHRYQPLDEIDAPDSEWPVSMEPQIEELIMLTAQAAGPPDWPGSLGKRGIVIYDDEVTIKEAAGFPFRRGVWPWHAAMLEWQVWSLQADISRRHRAWHKANSVSTGRTRGDTAGSTACQGLSL